MIGPKPSSHGQQPRRAAAARLDLHDADEKGSTRARAPGELIHDKLFGQELSKMISLPPAAAAVLAAAAAAARAALPHRHRSSASWCWQQQQRAQPARPRPPAAARRGPLIGFFCRTLLASHTQCVGLLDRTRTVCSVCVRDRACGWVSAVGRCAPPSCGPWGKCCPFVFCTFEGGLASRNCNVLDDHQFETLKVFSIK